MKISTSRIFSTIKNSESVAQVACWPRIRVTDTNSVARCMSFQEAQETSEANEKFGLYNSLARDVSPVLSPSHSVVHHGRLNFCDWSNCASAAAARLILVVTVPSS